MSEESTTTFQYHVGGSVPANALTYVKRKADNDLYTSLKAGKFCYVLNCRQMGKSSLMIRTKSRLQKEGINCVVIDLQSIGTGITQKQWYYNIADNIMKLNPEVEWKSWWRKQPEEKSSQQRLNELIETFLLYFSSHNIVIFLDEIDSVRGLSFKVDGFLVSIRAYYNKRADDPEYNRLTFALFGVAKPSDLIQNTIISPFNIGTAIELTGFKIKETKPLATGLITKADNPDEILKEILEWTGGQPFLSHAICELIFNCKYYIAEGEEMKIVKQIVQERIINNWQSQDHQTHMQTIKDRLLYKDSSKDTSNLIRRLELCQKILEDGEISADDSPEESSVQMDLRLTGLVVKDEQKLKYYNRIYRHIFDNKWLEQELTRCRPLLYVEDIKRMENGLKNPPH
ncbi:MAG: hypothetical protein F6K10_07730 [Moorea sp. SIO2B7]|nr:hypothetical protein [Moorena sp. SIO2B7]